MDSKKPVNNFSIIEKIKYTAKKGKTNDIIEIHGCDMEGNKDNNKDLTSSLKMKLQYIPATKPNKPPTSEKNPFFNPFRKDKAITIKKT